MAYPSVTYLFVNATTASASEVNQNFSDIINGISDGTKDINISAITAAGAATFNGTVNLGNATGDDVTITGYVASAIIPKTDDTYDLGTAALAWQDAYFDGAVYTDSILELTSDNGVVIDGVKCKDNNIEATTSGGLVIMDDGGNACITCADTAIVTLGTTTGTTHTVRHSINVGLSGLVSNSPAVSLRPQDSTPTQGTNYGIIESVISKSPQDNDTGSAPCFVLRCRNSNDSVVANRAKLFQMVNYTTEHLYTTPSGAFVVGNTALTTNHTIKNGASLSSTVLNVLKSSEVKNQNNNYYVEFTGSDGNEGYIQTNGSAVLSIVDTSDVRLKENIRNATYGLHTVKSLRPVEFDWKDSAVKNVKGFIAQEVREILPESVSVRDESQNGGLEDLHYLETQTMIPVMVKAIQELSAKLDEANARIAALEAR